jgi:hypothetical protein
MKTKINKPTQEECLDWLLRNHHKLYLESVKERDWVWIRGERGSPLFSGLTDSLKTFGFRSKNLSVHELSDGSDAVWYHSCQGKWRPGRGSHKKYRRGLKKEETLSKSAALKLANLI